MNAPAIPPRPEGGARIRVVVVDDSALNRR